MKLAGIVIGLFVAIVGLTGVIAPERMVTLSHYFVTPAGVFIAAALRITIGLVLAWLAPVSWAPRTLRILGVLLVIAGIATLFLSTDRVQSIVDWWTAQGSLFVRCWAGFALALGIFVIYAVTARRRSA